MMPRRSVVVMCAAAAAGAAVGVAGAQDGGQGSTGSGTAAPAQTVTAAPGGSGPAGLPTGTREQQTFPRLVPRTAMRTSKVAVYFTLADRPGHQGVVATAYDIEVRSPRAARAACRSAPPPAIDSGTQGTVVRVALTRPTHGWCRGTYAITIFLQRGPYCPKLAAGEPPQPCPLFASQELDVGHARLPVRVHARR